MSSSAAVKLTFPPEDTSPPEFSKSLYQHAGISSGQQLLAVSIVGVVVLLLLSGRFVLLVFIYALVAS